MMLNRVDEFRGLWSWVAIGRITEKPLLVRFIAEAGVRLTLWGS